MKYLVRYIHKINQTCNCQHDQGNHFRYVTDAKAPNGLQWAPGPCTINGCRCDGFVHETEVYELPELPDTPKVVGAILREHRLMSSHHKVREVRRNDADQVVTCFLQCKSWHAIIFTPMKET